MSGRTRILLIDSSTSDIALASLLLQQALPRAEIARVSDTASLLAALRGAMPDLVVAAPNADRAGFGNVLNLVRTTWPRSAVVVFGRPDEIARCALAPAATLHGIANKTSAGFMALPAVVRDILDRLPAPPRGGLDGWPLPAVRIDAAGLIHAANAALGEALGVALDELIGTPLAQRLASGEHERWNAFLAGGQADIALRLAGVAGRLRVARDANDAGELLGCLVEAPEGAPAALPADRGLATLRELQDMALVVSHDLKEPMQQVLRLVHRLEDARGAGPRADDKLLGQLRDSAARAAGMLDALLAYLSVSGRDSVPGPVDLNQCFAEALHNLRPAIEESRARISADPLPTVTGDAEQMVHLLQNLLANAIKFRGATAPLVHITSETHAGTHRIAIHDNGIGIDAAHRERVFEMGKRLHTQEEFPGTGMGLALCRRIMHRHGGSIRIEAAPRGGSVIVVELPQANAVTPQAARGPGS
jgi:signal transduction histidine kinase